MSLISIIVVIALAAAGWLVSLYFLLVYQGRINRRVAWMPRPLQMSGTACRNIVDTRYGRVFKYPNAAWGLVYYPLLVLLIVAGEFELPGFSLLIVAVTTLILLFGFYLSWGLYRLRVVCRSCIATHVLNLCIFLVILFNQIAD